MSGQEHHDYEGFEHDHMVEETKVRIGTAMMALIGILSSLGVAMAWASTQVDEAEMKLDIRINTVEAEQSKLEAVQQVQATIIQQLNTTIQLQKQQQDANTKLIKEAADAARENRETLIEIKALIRDSREH